MYKTIIYSIGASALLAHAVYKIILQLEEEEWTDEPDELLTAEEAINLLNAEIETINRCKQVLDNLGSECVSAVKYLELLKSEYALQKWVSKEEVRLSIMGNKPSNSLDKEIEDLDEKLVAINQKINDLSLTKKYCKQIGP